MLIRAVRVCETLGFRAASLASRLAFEPPRLRAAPLANGLARLSDNGRAAVSKARIVCGAFSDEVAGAH